MIWNRPGWPGIIAVCLLALGAPRVEAQQTLPPVLDLVSAQSQVIVVIPSLSRLSERMGQVNDAAGFGIPGLGDTLGEFKRSVGIVRGLRDDGPMVLAFHRIDAEGGLPFTMLLPVSDFGAFVGNFGGT